MADNVGALAGKTASGYIAGANGAVGMVHIRPHAPQLNPLETEWREIRAAIADIFFGCLDRMRDAIIRMFHNGEIPIVKMFDWLLPPPWLAGRSPKAPGPPHACRITAPRPSLRGSPRGGAPVRGPVGRRDLTAP